MQAMLVYPISPTQGIPGNHCTTGLEIWLSSQSWQPSPLGVSARWREEASRAAGNTRGHCFDPPCGSAVQKAEVVAA